MVSALKKSRAGVKPLKVLKTVLRWAFNIVIALIFFIPFYWMVITSLKTLGQTLATPPTFWVSDPQWQNYPEVFTKVDVWGELKNSLIVTAGTLVCQCITVIPAAYAFARYEFKGSKILFGITLATMMIPSQLIFLPVYLMFSSWGMINTYWSLILPSASSAFAIFMLRQTFKQVSEELLEAPAEELSMSDSLPEEADALLLDEEADENENEETGAEEEAAPLPEEDTDEETV